MRVERRRPAQCIPWRGFVAGALGGLAGSFAMSQFHSLVSRNAQTRSETGKEDSTVLAASAISRSLFHHELTAAQRKVAAPAMHYGFGTAVGAMYGMLVEFAKPASVGWEQLSARRSGWVRT